ncbi:MAG: hypothetical protein VCC00_12815 [Deltaproteobacteria bacterium]
MPDRRPTPGAPNLPFESPAALWAELRDKQPDTLRLAFERAHSLGRRGGVAMAICVGLVRDYDPNGPRALAELAATFGIHRSRIARLTRSWLEIIRPRLEVDKEAADFPLLEQIWYSTACEAAPMVSRGNIGRIPWYHYIRYYVFPKS